MVREQLFDVDGRRIRWLENGAGWPVLLIHAFPLNADMWRPQLERVPEGWRLIAPDLRGFGQSRLPAGPGTPVASLDDYAADLEALLDHLNIDELVIGGLSMGGYVTLALFRRSPDRFSGMLLADTKAEADTADGRAGRVAMRALLNDRGPAGVADQMLPKLLSEATRAADPGLVDRTRGLILSNQRDAIDQAIVAMMARPDSGPDLEKVNVPALVLVGEQDALTPLADAERLHARMSRSILTVIPEAGHLANVERPTEFTRALHDFLVAHM